MNLSYLGDALDHWKGALFEFLVAEHLLLDLAVDPMATDETPWKHHDFKLFARLLRVSDKQVLRHRSTLSARSTYFAEIAHEGDLFLDPDTGIDTGTGSPIKKYVKPREVAQLLYLSGLEQRVVAIYQHIRAQETRARVDRCLDALAVTVQHFGWCSYESGTVAMLFLSLDAKRTMGIARGFRDLLGAHAANRIWASAR